MFRCPGQDRRYLKPEDVYEWPCECGHGVEFFKDDITVICRQCGRRLPNPRFDMGCAAWCQSARECLGEEKYNQLKARAEGRARKDGTPSQK